MMMTSKIGNRLARVLDNIVALGLVTPKDIHLIGHSLGAHIAGVCGSSLTSGVIGRITGKNHVEQKSHIYRSINIINIILWTRKFIHTISIGLDPARPGFEYVKLQKKGLKRSDARFVDVIHTSGGSTGCFYSIGHADFFPNGGSPPQPGCYEGIRFERLIELGEHHSYVYACAPKSFDSTSSSRLNYFQISFSLFFQ